MDYVTIGIWALVLIGIPVWVFVKGIKTKKYGVAFVVNITLFVLGLFFTINGFNTLLSYAAGVEAPIAPVETNTEGNGTNLFGSKSISGSVDSSPLVDKIVVSGVYFMFVVIAMVYSVLMLISLIIDNIIKKTSKAEK